MQNQTGARIQVSQRGEYIPGTTNRPVTISGTQRAVASAQLMVHGLCSQAAQNEFRQVQQQQQGMQQQQQQYYPQQQGLMQRQRQQQQPQQQQQQQQQQQHLPPFY
ncbi:unnamed protein product [Ectocarpus sp. 8 AP-2014]